MIDGPTLTLIGLATQSIMPARAIVASLWKRPRSGPTLRGAGVLASLAFTPVPPASPTLQALVVRIDAPAIPGR